MVIDENNITQINTALLLLQRRLDRIVQAMNTFTDSFKSAVTNYETAIESCETVEDIKEISLDEFKNLSLKI